MGLEKPNSGPDPSETFFPNSVSDLGSAETFQISRNVGPVIDENVCLLDSQPWFSYSQQGLNEINLFCLIITCLNQGSGTKTIGIQIIFTTPRKYCSVVDPHYFEVDPD